LQVNLQPGPERPAAEHANFFHVANAGGEIQLLIGFADIEKLISHANRSPADSSPTHTSQPAEVTHRIVMGQLGFALLHNSIVNLAKMLPPGFLLAPTDGPNK
jgi:hypothetical protein